MLAKHQFNANLLNYYEVEQWIKNINWPLKCSIWHLSQLGRECAIPLVKACIFSYLFT